ncbi:unnamed protein product [Protopolystoma xenopodis]|uniref:UGGT thioredoxin-like domain-containing protein n=1 Tax=Protopolystoma xenopodis TaxID=117903 RepID=A0A448WPY4_9PLAT|nr:unnamed protein product [Protopolystoma xenopodis]
MIFLVVIPLMLMTLAHSESNNEVDVMLLSHCEFLARVSPSYFWNFIDLVGKEVLKQNYYNSESTSALFSMGDVSKPIMGSDYNRLLRLVSMALETTSSSFGDALDPLQRGIFHLMLASSSFSPAVETAHQIAISSSSFIHAYHNSSDFSGNIPCDPGVVWAQIGSTTMISPLGIDLE